MFSIPSTYFLLRTGNPENTEASDSLTQKIVGDVNNSDL